MLQVIESLFCSKICQRDRGPFFNALAAASSLRACAYFNGELPVTPFEPSLQMIRSQGDFVCELLQRGYGIGLADRTNQLGNERIGMAAIRRLVVAATR